jgi:hypothetical protein
MDYLNSTKKLPNKKYSNSLLKEKTIVIIDAGMEKKAKKF